MKHIYTIIICIFLFPCVAFLPKTEVDVDPIVGQWQIEKTIYYYSNSTIRTNAPVKCNNSKIFSYTADGTLNFYQFDYNSETEECSIPSKDSWHGTWKKSEDGNYIRSLTYKYNEKVRSRYVDSVGRFLFTDDQKEMTQILNYKESGVAMDPNSGLIEEHTVFKRIQ